jgi:hypothetical protein
MKVIVNTPGERIPTEVKGLVSAIQRKTGDCEDWLNAYNKHPFDFTWYGYKMIVEDLHASYGVIGYSIEYRGITVDVDNELRTIRIIYNE